MAVTYNILDLGKSHYNDAWKLQKRLQSQRISGQIDDQLLLVEHFPVYTLGKNTPREHLLTKESDNISIIQTDRGGDITFHGPGQLVGYPILDLNQYKRSITWYMRELEQLIIDVLKEYDILFQDGKVKQIAKNISMPRGNFLMIDGKGKHVTPGLIDAHSHMAGESINEGFQNVTAEVRMRDVIDPNDVAMYRALAGGLTTINLLHGSANPIGDKM